MSPKKVDGISRFLVKGDVAALMKHTEKGELEKILRLCWHVWINYYVTSKVSQAHGAAVFGKLCLRSICVMLKKKSDIEAATYKTLAEAQKQFDKDMQTHPTASTSSSSQGQSCDAKPVKVLNADDSRSAKAIANAQGFKVGECFMIKVDDLNKKLVKLTQIDEKSGEDLARGCCIQEEPTGI